jgi:hypothetical protein
MLSDRSSEYNLPPTIVEELQASQLIPYVDEINSDVDSIVLKIYENERMNLLYGWGSTLGVHLFPNLFDRHPYTDDLGTFF